MNNPDDKKTAEEGLLTTIENLFDWNLIAIISVWIFLLSTFFLLFAS